MTINFLENGKVLYIYRFDGNWELLVELLQYMKEKDLSLWITTDQDDSDDTQEHEYLIKDICLSLEKYGTSAKDGEISIDVEVNNLGW